MERKRLEKLIAKAKKIHGDKYDYSKSDAPTCKDKAIFICPIHGEFEQTWDNHINGRSGCPKCAKCHKYTNEYDYSKTHYTKAKDNVIVICHEKDEFGDEHGEFEIRAGNHMAGVGCPKCAKKYRPTTEEWIKRAKKVHGEKYNYTKVNYINQNTNVEIICPIHGKFKQMAALHIQGCGCPKCNGGIKMTKDDFVEKAQKIHKISGLLFQLPAPSQYYPILSAISIRIPTKDEHLFSTENTAFSGHFPKRRPQ